MLLRGGAALWAVDFNLLAMIKGVTRVIDCGRPTVQHASWIPDERDTLGSHGLSVRVPFAANAFIADEVGKIRHHVAEVSMGGKGSDTLSAYAGYSPQTGKLDRVALVNLKQRDENSGKGRKTTIFVVPASSSTGKVELRLLGLTLAALRKMSPGRERSRVSMLLDTLTRGVQAVVNQRVTMRGHSIKPPTLTTLALTCTTERVYSYAIANLGRSSMWLLPPIQREHTSQSMRSMRQTETLR